VIDHLARLQAQFDGSQLARLANRLDSAGVGFVHCCSPLRLSDRCRSAAQLSADSSAVVITAAPASYGCVDQLHSQSLV